MPKIRMLGPRIPTLDTRKVRPEPSRGDPSPYRSERWVKFRKEIIAERGRRCEDPEHDPTKSASVRLYLDHIIELKDGGPMYERSNLMLRCPSCHTAKTLRERGKRAAKRY